MYIPPAFAENRKEELLAIMRSATLPVLVSPGATGLLATHLPMMFTTPDRLIGHVAKANPHWQEILPGAESMAIFTANDFYVSPSWYPSKSETGKVVPTWNYRAVHATGHLEIIDDPEELLDIVTSLTNQHEEGRAKPWAVKDAPEDYVTAQLKGIVGLILHVTKLEGKAKLSQNKSLADRQGVVEGIALDHPELAATMMKTI